jgi:mannobiose 2-epimerase
MKKHLASLKESASQELDHILEFWMKYTIDMKNGGFHGEISSDLQIVAAAPKGLVLNARILWTFSKAYLVLKDAKYQLIAKRAYDYLIEAFWDHDYEGYFWTVDEQGKPCNTRKQIYGQAFTIYGLTEYYKASGNPESLQRAITLFRKVEAESFDSLHLGYFEAYNRDWSLTDDMRLSGVDLNEKKSMNTHLHILEAYSNLMIVWDDPQLRQQQKQLTEIMLDKIVDENEQHFKLFFDEDWHSKSEHISFGHDIEGSWLLVEAAHILNDAELTKRVEGNALKMARAVLKHGVDTDGALWNEAAAGYKIIDAKKDWWPQAEAAVGFMNAYQLSSQVEFLTASIKSWDFIIQYLIDRKNGEWFWNVSEDRQPDYSISKVSEWKCPYHNSRACFELMERIEKLEKIIL